MSGAYPALAPLNVAAPGDHYTDRALQTTLLFLSAAGVQRLAHVNDQPIAAWGTVLDTARRPDADTLAGYLRAIQLRDAAAAPPTNAPPALAEACPAVGQIRPGGPIAQALSQALVARVEAGLCQDPVWYFDGHTIEYSGQAQIGKTLHGTKHISVKAIDEYCLFNHVPGLTCYYPTSVPYAEALRAMLIQAQTALPADRRIRMLAFDKEGWDADLLQWLVHGQAITPFTWVKDTAPNRALLAGVDLAEFVGLAEAVTVGKSDQEHRVRRLADVDLTFRDLGVWRVVVLETETGTRLGICTTALRPAAALAAPQAMSTVAVLNTMRYKQRIENGFKVWRHEMAGDALPTHQIHTVVQAEPYDLAQAQSQVSRAEQRLTKQHAAQQHLQELWERGELDKHELNALTARTSRLAAQAQAELDGLASAMTQAQTDPVTGQTTLIHTTECLDLRKLTLLNLFKEHALIALHILAHLLGCDGAGPERLRREFLAHGDRVEFDPEQRIMTVFAKPFPRARTQRAYEWLCVQLNQRPVTFIRDEIPYRVRFSW